MNQQSSQQIIYMADLIKSRRTLKKSVAFQNISLYNLFKKTYDFTETEHSLIRKCCLPSLLTYLFQIYGYSMNSIHMVRILGPDML